MTTWYFLVENNGCGIPPLIKERVAKIEQQSDTVIIRAYGQRLTKGSFRLSWLLKLGIAVAKRRKRLPKAVFPG